MRTKNRSPALSRDRSPSHASSSTPAESAVRELARASGLLRRLAEPHLAKFGISPAQWGILRTLHRVHTSGDLPPRVTDLGALLLIRPPGISGVVDRLVRMGLVMKVSSRGDGRTRCVRLTAAGHRLVQRVLKGHSAWIGSLMAGLSGAEHEDLTRLLKKMSWHLEPLADRSGKADPPAEAARNLARTAS